MNKNRINQNNFNGEACIAILLDKSQDLGLREDAADSLMWYLKPQSCQAMLKVILDEAEDTDLRMEVAGCLGSLWAEMGYEDEEMSSVPEKYKSEILNEMNLVKNKVE